MSYDELDFVVPVEASDYLDRSTFVVSAMTRIVQSAIDEGRNKIIINTNLKLGLPTVISAITRPWELGRYNYAMST